MTAEHRMAPDFAEQAPHMDPLSCAQCSCAAASVLLMAVHHMSITYCHLSSCDLRLTAARVDPPNKASNPHLSREALTLLECIADLQEPKTNNLCTAQVQVAQAPAVLQLAEASSAQACAALQAQPLQALYSCLAHWQKSAQRKLLSNRLLWLL